METLTTTTFKTKIYDFEASKDWQFRGERPAIIDFYADWCGPCRALAPIMEELSSEYQGKVDIYKLDTEASPEIAALFGIRSIPSVLFIPQKGEPAMATGLAPKDSLKKAIREILEVSD